MAAGCPIVATDVGGLPGLVPETAGLLVAANDPAALATALAAVYRSREGYVEFVAGARSAPASTQDIAAMLNAYRAVYADSTVI
jgi:glycosyltransferase involved in cell wall biosynthesis